MSDQKATLDRFELPIRVPIGQKVVFTFVQDALFIDAHASHQSNFILRNRN